VIIYYNPDCSKCREALDLLNGANCEVTIRNYLNEPPSASELKVLVEKLGCKPSDLVRRSEPLYTEKFSGDKYTEEEWLEILSENPILIERPIVVNETEALIGRPPMLVLSLVKK
jgi:arsenate reductase